MSARLEQGRVHGLDYLRGLRHYPRLSQRDEQELATRARSGDVTSYQSLVRSNLGFVVKIALSYRNLGLPLEDLVGEGNVGLLEAARRFDPARGTRFTTCAVHWVRRSILRAVARHSLPVQVPEQKRRELRAVLRAASVLKSELGREPGRQEVSERLALSPAKIDAILQRRVARVSMSDPVSRSEVPVLDVLADRRVADPETQALVREGRRAIDTVLRGLEPRERQVVGWRFGLEGGDALTLREVGLRLSLSREAVRLIEKRALRCLRRRLLAGRHARQAAPASMRSTASPTLTRPAPIT